MITDITPEQEAKIPEYLELGLKLGLRTDPIDQTKARAAVNYLYKKFLNLEEPRIVFVSSPKELKEHDIVQETISNTYLSYYIHSLFLAEVVVPDKSVLPELKEFIDHLKEVHNIYCYENVCFVSDFPEVINVKDNDLVAVNGVKVKYRDGYFF